MSRLAESENSAWHIGSNTFSSSWLKWADLKRASLDFILLMLPFMVLISPLWAIYLKGWANRHSGNVLVEKRE